MRGEKRTVVAVVGDGALTGGMCWEALNNIAAAKDHSVVVLVNDNGRSYSETIGGLAEHLTTLRTNPRYEKALEKVREVLTRTPLVGDPLFDALHGIKRGLKDVLTPQGLFEDLGLKYVGPIDGHDIAAVEAALARARKFGGPVIVHCVTRKGYGYGPAEDDELDHLHGPRRIRPGDRCRVAEAGQLDRRVLRRDRQDRRDEARHRRDHRRDVAPGRARPRSRRPTRIASSTSASPSSTR